MTRPLVISHAHCADGLVAAWCLFQAFGTAADYVFCRPSTDDHLKDDVTGRDVYFVDFSAPRADLIAMAAQAKSVTVADHHATAREALSNESQWAPANLRLIFDMTKAGCRLAWELATELRKVPTLKAPPLVAYTEDRDLWNWKLPHSHEINAWLGTMERSFDGMTEASRILRMSPDVPIAAGSAILVFRDICVKSAVNGLRVVEDGKGRLVLFGNVTEFGSEVGNDALIRHPEIEYVAMYRDAWEASDKGSRVFSLRARKGGVNVGAIAKANGGGGHPAAAGFRFDMNGSSTWKTE